MDEMQFKIFDVDEYKSKLRNKEIIIYGNGWMAHLTAIFLSFHGIEDVTYANYAGVRYAAFKKVISFEELVDSHDEETQMILWAVSGYSKYESAEFEKNGICSVYSVRQLWKISENIDTSSWKDIYRNEYEKRDDFFFFEDVIESPEKIYIYCIEAMVTERCSLRCRDCANLMQYYPNPQNCDIDELKKSIDVLLKKVDKIHDLHILGGEPFMNLKFVNLIEWYQNEEKINRITVFTNGTILPNAEHILEYLKNPKVMIRFSDYGNLSKALDKWVAWCKENHVRFQVAKADKWFAVGHLERRDYTDHQLKDMYGNCGCRECSTIIGNKLFNCEYAANAFNLGAIAADEALKDYIEISENLTGEQIDRFLYERPYLEACRYCSGRNAGRASVAPHIQIEAPLDYQKLSHIHIGSEARKIKPTGRPNNEELISVVVPVYNAEKTVERCVRSIVDQTYSKLEIFLVDDGSSDRSADICESLAKTDIYQRITVIRNDHKGVVMARNTAIRLATGKYITFVDADDFIEPDSVEKLVEGMQGGYDLCFMGWYHERKLKRIADSQFDRGQGLTEILHSFPKEGEYKGTEIIQMLVDHIYVRWDGLFDPLWNKMFITEKMKQTSNPVDGRIVWKEDALYVLIYMVECERINVINYVGYHYIESESEKVKPKYDYDKLAFGVRYLRRAIDEIAKNKSNAIKNLYDTIYFRALEHLIDETDHHRKYGRLYYYPWYSRLSSKRVVLYGAGEVGRSYYKSMQEDTKTELVAWVDKNASQIREEYLFPVEDVDCLKEKSFDCIIVAVHDEAIYRSIKAELSHYGIPDDKVLWNPTKLAGLY